MSSDEKVSVGLRERKKVKTRIAIQKKALRLFRKQGYYETTVEQIAAAAEVSPSTFFRYFPSKEDLVLYDSLDPLIIEAFESQPSEAGPIRAIRETMRSVFGALSEEEMAEFQEREKLMRTIPELRSRMLDDFFRSLDMFTQMVSRRLKLAPEDIRVRTTVGALTGVMISIWFTEPWDTPGHMMESIDLALAQLEKGLKF